MPKIYGGYLHLASIIWCFGSAYSDCHEICLIVSQGAYTGVCSAQHVPSYKNNSDKFKAKGIDHVICVAINDPYVMNGWAEKLQAKDDVS